MDSVWKTNIKQLFFRTLGLKTSEPSVIYKWLTIHNRDQQWIVFFFLLLISIATHKYSWNFEYKWVCQKILKFYYTLSFIHTPYNVDLWAQAAISIPPTLLTLNSYYSIYDWFISLCCNCNEYAYNVDIKLIPFETYVCCISLLISVWLQSLIKIYIPGCCCCIYNKR